MKPSETLLIAPPRVPELTQTMISFALSFLILAVFTLFPDNVRAFTFSVHADLLGYPLTGTPPADPTAIAFQKIITAFTGITGKAICTVAVLAAGMGALFHRISWVQAAVISAGIGIVFGAASLVKAAAGGGTGITASTGTLVCDSVASVTSSTVNINIALNRSCEMLRLIINTVSGGLGAAIATLAVIFLGLGALFGKISWPQALVLTLGIGLLFGAGNIVYTIWVQPSDCLANDIFNIITGSEVQFILCRFLAEIRGDAGKFMATIAVMILGFLALMGRLSITVAMVTVVGIVAVFGSDQIVNILVPNIWSCNNIKSFNLNLSAGAIQGVLCNVLGLVTGVPGKALASASVVMLGFGAMLGKVSYGAALITAVGIAIAFGAPQIVFLLTSSVDKCALSATFAADVNPCSSALR